MKNKRVIIIFILFLLVCPAISFIESYAPYPKLEVDYPSLPPFAKDPPKSSFEDSALPKYVAYMFGLMLIIAAILAVVMIAIGGTEYLSSAGSPDRMRSGTEKIISSVLGLVILACSYLILVTINPNLVKLDEPYVANVIPKLGYGVWACRQRVDFESLWKTYKDVKKSFKETESISNQFKKKSKADQDNFNKYIEIRNLIQKHCYHAITAGSVPTTYQKNNSTETYTVSNEIPFVYLVPEEGKRAFGAILYEDKTQKSKAKIIYGDGDNEVVLDNPLEWPIDNKKVAYIRPFEIIENPPTEWYAKLYQMPRKNRNAPEAKMKECSTHGSFSSECDLSSLAPATASPGDCAEGSESCESEGNNGEKPPKIGSVEFNGSQALIFFKEKEGEWTQETELDTAGPGEANNLASGAYIMGEWNPECKEASAENPNNTSFYPCAKEAILISAIFM